MCKREREIENVDGREREIERGREREDYGTDGKGPNARRIFQVIKAISHQQQSDNGEDKIKVREIRRRISVLVR